MIGTQRATEKPQIITEEALGAFGESKRGRWALSSKAPSALFVVLSVPIINSSQTANHH
ncbi:MAG: hypothetical protein LBV74_03940 [Tannerella sp.]|jgi:hypothetical protein|nr:hypothetical protein [Tannerella sp.]